MGRLATTAVLAQIALRNLFASRLKTLIIGGIILFGAVLVVVGGALLDSMDQGMRRSIVGSVAGHIQIYSARSKDALAIWGNMGGDPDLAAIDDFTPVARALERMPNVKAVVPMGISGALITSGNTIDIALAKLREAVNRRRAGDATGDAIANHAAHVRQMVRLLHADLKTLRTLADERAIDPANAEAVDRALSDAFWAEFDRDPLAGLEFLENRIAPQVADSDLLWLRYVGTDLDAFARSFDRMEIVDGQAVPPGRRGFLFSKLLYEETCKLRTARRLDKIREALTLKGKRLDADPDLRQLVKENVAQVREIELQLDPAGTRTAIERLRAALGSAETELGPLLVRLLDTKDENFLARNTIFYRDIAPLLELYRIRIGDTLTIKAFTRTGYVQSVNVRVYGTFRFKGLEGSLLAGGLNLMDLMSFRQLYGYLTVERAEEIRQIRRDAEARDVDRARAEDELFGAGSTIVAEATPGLIDEASPLSGDARALRDQDRVSRVYSRAEIEKGVVLNAAVVLEDPHRIRETIDAIRAVSDRDKLGITPISWQEAAGLLGQIILLFKLVLYAAVFIIFLVAMLIINNAMMMATLERVREIGTMRAVGAQRGFVLRMLAVESAVLGVIFGGLGALVGAGIVRVMAWVGIPAVDDALQFFFSGPRLHPALGATNLVASLLIVLTVAAIATYYPARLAGRVSPVVAMQTEE